MSKQGFNERPQTVTVLFSCINLIPDKPFSRVPQAHRFVGFWIVNIWAPIQVTTLVRGRDWLKSAVFKRLAFDIFDDLSLLGLGLRTSFQLAVECLLPKCRIQPGRGRENRQRERQTTQICKTTDVPFNLISVANRQVMRTSSELFEWGRLYSPVVDFSLRDASVCIAKWSKHARLGTLLPREPSQ